MKALSRLILCSTVLFALTAGAYIPNLNMIVDRLGRSHAYGMFLIDQEVIFPAQPTPYIVKEQWMIDVDGNLRLRVKGERQLKDQLDITIVYMGGKKYYIDGEGRKKVTKVGSDFVDRIFFSNNSDRLKQAMRNFSIALPGTAGDNMDLSVKIDDTHSTTNPGKSNFLNLARVGGVVAYRVGKKDEFGVSEKSPNIWIEQDQFHVLKLRLPSQVEVTAKGYSRHGRGFHYPKTRIIQTQLETFQINLRQVQAISKSATNRKLLSQSSLDAKKYPHLKLKLPEVDSIKNFYRRYR